MKLKKITLCTIFLSFIFLANAQKWHFDFNDAKERAQKENKNILIVFQGSDWCVPCIKLDRKVWHSDVFKKFADGNLILQKVDFPKRKKNKLSAEQEKKNNALAKQYNKDGYLPHVVLVDSKGKLIKNMDTSELNPKKYVAALQAVQ